MGAIPLPRHPRLRESCRFDLARFGWIYCRACLQHKPSALIRERLILKIQGCMLGGGQIDVELARGLGKTTWMEIADVWAMLYGHRRFPVQFAATAPLARAIMNTCWRIIEQSDAILADFPAIAMPIRALRGVTQRAAAQTYLGEPTRIEKTADHFRLPMLRDAGGNPLDIGCGALMGCVGVGGSVRGLLDMGVRPDVILADDPQTKKDAFSPARTEWIESFIHQDALGLAAHTGSIAAFVTITPQRYGDVATRLSSQSDHPEWSVTKQPFIEAWAPGCENLIPEFIAAYNFDAASDDFTRKSSRAWYKDHADKFAGTIVADPLAYDPKTEFDAIHHALNVRARVGEQSWMAEYMLRVADVESELSVDAETVMHALNGAPMLTLPPGCNSAVAFCDVNLKHDTGLSWVICAFGPRRVAAVVAYGRHTDGFAPNMSDLKKVQAVARGIRAVVEIVKRANLRTADGQRVHVKALGFDRGYMPEVVCRSLAVIRQREALPFQICAMRGFGWKQFGSGRKDVVGMGDHVFVTKSERFGQYMAVHAPYWREIAQAGFLETALMPGSVSLFGTESARHYEFANEVAAERLLRKFVDPSGKVGWDWAESGKNHYCDCLTGCFALASWNRLYDALPRAVDAAARKAPASLDLFDPMKNPAILAPYDDGYVEPTQNLPPSVTAPRVKPARPRIHGNAAAINLRRVMAAGKWRKRK